VLFNILINSLFTDIKALDIGIDIEGGKIGILLYADDIVLIAENENDLQLLLHILNTRCKHKVLCMYQSGNLRVLCSLQSVSSMLGLLTLLQLSPSHCNA
jgi:hypothetical protein